MPNMGMPRNNTKKIPDARHAVARAFWGWKKYPNVRLGPSAMGTPAMNSKFPSRIKALLKKRLIPSTVIREPDPNNKVAICRFPVRNMDGTLSSSDDDDDDGDDGDERRLPFLLSCI